MGARRNWTRVTFNYFLLFFIGSVWGVITLATSNRFVTILGGFLCALGFLCMALSPNHYYLHISMAIMSKLCFISMRQKRVTLLPQIN